MSTGESKESTLLKEWQLPALMPRNFNCLSKVLGTIAMQLGVCMWRSCASKLFLNSPDQTLPRVFRRAFTMSHSKNIDAIKSNVAASDAIGQIAVESEALRKTKVAVAQMTSIGDTEFNFQTCSKLAEEAASQGAKMLFLPEAFSFVGSASEQTVAIAEPVTGHTISKYAALAKRLNLWLSLGGFQEVGPDPEHVYNSHLILTDNGEIAAIYRKIHLFSVDIIPKGPVLMESRYTAPGTGLITSDSPAGRLGLSTCYDLRFPELYQRLVFEKGAQVLLVPSAFTVPTGRAHWEVLLRARAIETQTYVIAAAQAGKHNEKRESYGHSLIIDPWGTIVGKLDDPLATGIAVAEIDLGELESIRQRIPIAVHRAAGKPAVASDWVA